MFPESEMLIEFLSIEKLGDYQYYEIAPSVQSGCYGGFTICSLAHKDYEIPSGVKGEINGGEIVLLKEGQALPFQLQIGNKSTNQLKLWLLDCNVPHTVVLDFSIGERFKKDEKFELEKIYEQLISKRLSSSVAIRCSSNLEDGDTQSFAGTFDTFLDVTNELEEIQEKIVQSYHKFSAYRDSHGEFPSYDIRLGIMLQEMIHPKFSGVLFTLDPVNPPSNWMKIECWKGVREGSEEYTITLNRETGKRVISGRESNRILLSTNIQNKLYQATEQIEGHFGIPQDIEFLVSGDEDDLFLVQSRPITAFSYSPDKIRLNEERNLSDIKNENLGIYNLDPILSSTNIDELFPRAIPLGFSIFKFGFVGTRELEGGISEGRSRLGYAKLDPEDRENLFYTVAGQARANIIVDALTFRLPFISKSEYLDIFVKKYLQQIKRDPALAIYPEDGLYLQTNDLDSWIEIAGERGRYFLDQYNDFLIQIVSTHAQRELQDSEKFFQQNDDRYRPYLNRDIHKSSIDCLKKEIEDIISYLRTNFCPQYVVFARLAFLCTYLSKASLPKIMDSESDTPREQIINELLRSVSTPSNLDEPQYPEFERLFKQGRIPLVEFLYRFQHLGSLDITQPRLGEYSLRKLNTLFGEEKTYGPDGEFQRKDVHNSVKTNLSDFEFDNDLDFQRLYTFAGQFMRLREKAKSDLLKMLWVLKLIFTEISWRYRFGDMIFYLELDEARALNSKNREKLRMRALQRKAYFDACQQYRVNDVLLNMESSPFKKNSIDVKDGERLYKFAGGKTIFHGNAEGFCITARSNDEFIDKLAVFKAKNIENIIGIFKGVELSYFNLSALSGFTTENGGFLSHAATIAREFRLPYITDIEVDLLRDEDYIIFDTENNQVIIRR